MTSLTPRTSLADVRLRLINFRTFFRAALGEGCIESRVIGRVYGRCSQEGKDSTHPHGVGQHARGRFQLASRYGRLGRSVGRFQLGFLPDPTHPTSIEHPPTYDCALTKGHPLLLGSCTSVSSRYQSEHPALKGFLPKDKGLFFTLTVVAVNTPTAAVSAVYAL